MTSRNPAELPAPVEALLASWPVPERSDEEWEASARAIAARLGAPAAARPEPAGAPGDEGFPLDDATLVAAPLPRTAEEPAELQDDRRSSPRLTPTATPRPAPGPAARSLADLARSRVDEPDRERRLAVAKQSLDHVARARSRGEVADSIARTAEARSGDRPSLPLVPPRRDRVSPATLGAALGLLAAAAAILVLVQTTRQPPGAVAPTVAAASRPTLAPEPGRVAPPADEERVARLDDLPPSNPLPPPVTGRPLPGAGAPRDAAKVAAVAGAASAASEPDEFDTPLEHAESRPMPLAPTMGEAIAALAPSLGRAKVCVAGHSEPSTAVITFGADGAVSSVAVSGPAAGTPAGSCIEAAFRGARVAPFAKPSFSVSYPVRP